MCIREFEPDKFSFVLNAMCSAATDCSVGGFQRGVLGSPEKLRDELPEIELEMEGEFLSYFTYNFLPRFQNSEMVPVVRVP